MKKTAVLFTQKYLNHNPGRDHPESANRLKVIMSELKASSILETGKCALIEPEQAQVEDVELVHNPDYIQLVKRVCKSGGGLLDLGDTVVSPESFETALYAVGGAIKAVDLVTEGSFQNAFALVRPPGHHAGPYYASGFCIFNNVAVAAAHLLRNFGLDRVLILDIDAHHGNGTQEIFYNSNKVLYMSLHQDPRGFPGTGFIDEIGEGEGVGYTVNVPFPFRIDDQTYLEAIDQIIMPILNQFKPQFILASVGFDGHYTDPVASLSLSAFAYTETFEKILDSANKLCGGKFVAVLEGGYNLRFLGKIATAAMAKMAGTTYVVQDSSQTANSKIQKQAETVLAEVRRAHSPFWKF